MPPSSCSLSEACTFAIGAHSRSQSLSRRLEALSDPSPLVLETPESNQYVPVWLMTPVPSVAHLQLFPMPPSSNNIYLTLKNRRRVKSKEMREFERDAVQWSMAMGSQLDQARSLAKICQAQKNLAVDVHCQFFFKRERIRCKDGTPKRLDTSNRFKALHDMLSQILKLDDCYFWHVSGEKHETTGRSPEQVSIRLSLRTIP
jgi:hypothetical protein